VQYSGAGGRDGLFDAAQAIGFIKRHVAPLLRGAALTDFRAVAATVDGLLVNGERLHTAIRYGVTQALLDAVARMRKVTMAEVVRDEYQTGVKIAPVPMFVQSGDDRYGNVDKMVLKEADVLPHGLVNQVGSTLGSGGEILAQYVSWVRDRVLALRARGLRAGDPPRRVRDHSLDWHSAATSRGLRTTSSHSSRWLRPFGCGSST
jgi:methylaspartate ammonia-lyase